MRGLASCYQLRVDLPTDLPTLPVVALTLDQQARCRPLRLSPAVPVESPAHPWTWLAAGLGMTMVFFLLLIFV